MTLYDIVWQCKRCEYHVASDLKAVLTLSKYPILSIIDRSPPAITLYYSNTLSLAALNPESPLFSKAHNLGSASDRQVCYRNRHQFPPQSTTSFHCSSAYHSQSWELCYLSFPDPSRHCEVQRFPHTELGSYLWGQRCRLRDSSLPLGLRSRTADGRFPYYYYNLTPPRKPSLPPPSGPSRAHSPSCSSSRPSDLPLIEPPTGYSLSANLPFYQATADTKTDTASVMDLATRVLYPTEMNNKLS